MRTVLIACAALLGAAAVYSPVVAHAKTASECRAEWRANKADNQAKKIKESTYVKDCVAGKTTAAEPAPATAPAAEKPKKKASKKTAPAAGTASAPATAPTPATEPKATPAPKPAAAAAGGAYQYTTEAQAKMRCATGTVVWANLSSKIYHFSGSKSYGHTKSGAYMCETDATGEGMRAAKNEKHP
jgi:hypothetical protein